MVILCITNQQFKNGIELLCEHVYYLSDTWYNFQETKGMPFSQNQFQAVNHYYNYMSFISDSTALENASFYINDYRLSGDLCSCGGSQGI